MTTQMILITGNTYPVKEALKAMGARWDAASKGWKVPQDKAAQARQIVSGAPVKAAKPTYATESYDSASAYTGRGNERAGFSARAVRPVSSSWTCGKCGCRSVVKLFGGETCGC